MYLKGMKQEVGNDGCWTPVEIQLPEVLSANTGVLINRDARMGPRLRKLTASAQSLWGSLPCLSLSLHLSLHTHCYQNLSMWSLCMRGLDFLTARWSHGNWTVYMVAESFKSKYSREQGGSFTTFYDPHQKSRNFTSTISYGLIQSQKPIQF